MNTAYKKWFSKIMKKQFVLITFLCIVLGFYLAYHIFVASKKEVSPWVVPNLNNISKKFITKEAIVNGIHEKKELITQESDLTETIVLDDSWGNLSIFKKVQSITFFGKGIYVVDLSKLKTENITLQHNTKTIILKLPKPFVKSISMNEEKTIYETPSNGFLRFGEIKLSPAESQILLQSVKDKMSKKLLEPPLYGQALNNTENSLKELIASITHQNNEQPYSVQVVFEE